MRKTMERDPAASETPAAGRVITGWRIHEHISEAGQVSQGPTAATGARIAKTKRRAFLFHGGRGTYGPEELDLILSFSTFSHGCKGARSAASAGSAPLWILAYS